MGTRVPLRKTDTREKDIANKLEMSTAEIGLTVRTTNCLEERGIFTVNDLLNCTREDLLGISNFGEKTLEEVYKALEGIGFRRTGQEDRAPRRRDVLRCLASVPLTLSVVGGGSCCRLRCNRDPIGDRSRLLQNP